ncbi:MAG: A/G-specific adenine glycosylase [Bacteroidia bacterium]|nr:A/G-specific adenine glycosylase [Bacteroidia bacterium]NNJ56236.1 A/G-specific adenine glycosylase [Bacteroidia bacterium]
MRISELLIKWYSISKRDLPWRNTNDPYKIWLSEVMLQQTRVEQGMPYYHKFIEHYPTISDLANATEQEVLTLWQGLGYYSRARNMHSTAQYISNNLGSQFPQKFNEILELKGVGAYTAAAISSFAFNLPYPVIDGNVQRVVSRLFCIEDPINKPIGQKKIREAVDQIFDKRNPAKFNQAIMELGSLVCTPKNPTCDSCPLSIKCPALLNGKVKALPKKEGKTKVKEISHTYFVFKVEDKTYIQQRKEGIWKNMYQFPLLELDVKPETILDHVMEFIETSETPMIQHSYQTKHLLSHRKINANFYTISLHRKPIFLKSNIFEIELNELSKKYPTSVLTQKFLKSCRIDD